MADVPTLPPTATPRRTKRRRLRTLLAGAVLTLATTWAPPLIAHYTRGDLKTAYNTPGLDAAILQDCPIPAPRDWTIRTWQWSAGPGLRRDLLSECVWAGSTLGSTESTQPNRTRTVVSSGWPLRIAEFTEFDPDMPPSLASKPGAWFRYGVPISYRQRLPMRVHPLALLINLGFWTAIALATRAAAIEFRASRRRRRGLCIACAYPLSRAAICPECGEAAPRFTRESAS